MPSSVITTSTRDTTTGRTLKYRLESLRKLFSHHEQGAAVFIPYLALFIALSIPFSVLIFNRVMHAGQSTQFSLSDPRLGWTPGPTTRGSITIVWSCFSTVLTCSYVALHLDVPATASDAPSTGKFKAFLKTIKQTIVRKGGWIIFNVLAPELTVQVAFSEYLSAEHWKKEMKMKMKNDNWTLTHAFFADMGGFKIQVQPKEKNEEELEYDVLRSGEEFYERVEATGKMDKLQFKQLGLEIRGMSKADWLLKTVTCIQAAWLVVQIIARFIESRPISVLEATTCSYVVCALITYVFWWKKPYGVQAHIDLRVHATSGSEQKKKPVPTPFNRYIFPKGLKDDKIVYALVTPIVGAIIGSIHCALWNATFVNSNGQLLWRTCCIVQICAPFCSLPLAYIAHAIVDNISDFPRYEWLYEYWEVVAYSVGGFAFLLYFCARITMFLLIAYSFKSLPAGVYTDVEWSVSWFPHWH